MCSTSRQRYFMEERENRITRPFTGKVRMLLVALDYEGTASPLNCTVDTERIAAAARQAGVRDITRLYDSDKLGRDDQPSADIVRLTIGEIGSRCAPEDYFVFCYSGHGSSVENPDAPSGLDCLLCLRNNGKDETMVDNEIAETITDYFHPDSRILILCDACKSGGIMDADTPGIWGRLKACAISGCQEYQCSVDTGNGGVMTNALLKCINHRAIRHMRKRRAVSVQYIFNRMVECMPDDDGSSSDYSSDEWDSQWGSDEESYYSSDYSDDYSDDERLGEDDGYQDLNLSWPGGCDPSRIAFPF